MWYSNVHLAKWTMAILLIIMALYLQAYMIEFVQLKDRSHLVLQRRCQRSGKEVKYMLIRHALVGEY